MLLMSPPWQKSTAQTGLECFSISEQPLPLVHGARHPPQGQWHAGLHRTICVHSSFAHHRSRAGLPGEWALRCE